MGQKKPSAAKQKAWETLLQQQRADAFVWPQELMSFELWCTMTEYDPAVANGGKAFQDLMHYLLVEGKGPIGDLKRYDGTYYPLSGKDLPNGWTPEKKQTTKNTDAELHETTTSGVYIHSAFTQGRHKVRGAGPGNNSGVSVGFTYATSQKDKQMASNWQTAVTKVPYSRSNWLQTLHTELQVSSGPSQNTSVQFYSDGDGTVGKCKEYNGCMSQGNLIACIYGLYYYEGCNHADYNWTVRQTIDSNKYDVRMRMWNPNYELVGTRLYVKEVLNVHTAQFPLREKGAKYVGGKEGVRVPKLFFENGVPMQPTQLIRGADDNIRIAPFWGSGETTQKGVGITPDNDGTRTAGTLMASKFEIAFKPAGDLYFGFNVPKAHWMYPHHVPDPSEVTERTYAAKNAANLPGEGLYQPWPTWQDKWDTPAKRLKVLDPNTGVTKHYQLFKYETPTNVEDARNYALGLPLSENVTVHAPTVIEQVDVNDQVDDDDDDDVEEDDSDDDVAVDTTMEGTPQAEELRTAAQDSDLTDKVATMQSSVQIGFSKDHALGASTLESLAETELDDVLSDTKSRKDLFDKVSEDKQAMIPGDKRTPKDLNSHFKSSAYSPWPHEDIYDTAKLEVLTETMSAADVEAYADKYGSKHNLYLHGETQAKRITGVKAHFGEAQPIIHTRLDKDTPVHRRNLCRILLIYFDKDAIGKKGGKSVTYEDKQRGMEEGVYCLKKVGTQSAQQLHFGKPKGRNANQYKPLWPPVFERKPAAALGELLQLDRFLGDDSMMDACAQGADITRVRSEMSVLEWVTSPWHYAYLAYQPEQLLFKDGETYSEGCRRCSRPFYEYEHMYMWYKLSHVYTQHWPVTLWSPSPAEPKNAPRPFHDPAFWDTDNPSKVKEKDDDVVVEHLGMDEDGGWHNWPTFDFQLDKKGVLQAEYEKRFEANLSSNRKDLKTLLSNRLASFKRYMNSAYNPKRLQFWGGGYPTFPQGRCASGKVRMGMQEYHLQRASKYGNCCRDCAAVLEFAPGLFHRNHRETTDVSVVRGRADNQKLNGLWWANLIGRARKEKPNVRFDPDLVMHSRLGKERVSRMPEAERESFMKLFDQNMAVMQSYIAEHHGTNTMGTMTKHRRDSPDIYAQKHVPLNSAVEQKDYVLIQEALQDLRKVLDGEFDDLNLANSALKDLVRELEIKYKHEQTHSREKASRIFDPDMVRIEYRDVRIDGRTLDPITRQAYTMAPDGKVYHNCLVTKLYQPKVSHDGVYHKPTAADYVTKIYYATRKGANGERNEHPAAAPSMWCGDGYVTTPLIRNGSVVQDQPYVRQTDPQRADPKHAEQYRPMRQSRLFITYSLHKPVTSQIEARGIIEKMRDATCLLYGEDKFLSQLLVFGYMLGGFKGKDMTSDSVSKGRFVVIDHTNKKDKMAHFYGMRDNTSYLYDTYETHVDSVAVDGGIEIGPQRHHPHFHILLTLNHWSYVQIDYMKMNAYLEQMFRGVDPALMGWGDRYKLLCASGRPFYTDSENPYVDIKLYPQDNWQEIIAAYVRKNATPGIFEALKTHAQKPADT